MKKLILTIVLSCLVVVDAQLPGTRTVGEIAMANSEETSSAADFTMPRQSFFHPLNKNVIK
jgi:hypothetical protein